MTTATETVYVRDGLERGRGDSARQLVGLDRDQALETLLGCITNDPGYDRQVESRDLYYARSMVDLGAPVELLESHLFPSIPVSTDDLGDRDGLTLSVIGTMARLGQAGAVEMLRHYVKVGPAYEAAISELAWLEDDAVFEGLADEAVQRFVDNDDSICVDEGRPWNLWRAHPYVAEQFQRYRRVVEERQKQDRSTWSTSDFLSAAEQNPSWASSFARSIAQLSKADRQLLIRTARSSSVGARCAALIALGDLNDDVVLDIAPELLPHDSVDDTDHLGRAARRAIFRLHSPRALSWARAQDLTDLERVTSWLAVHILTGNADEQDAPRILDLLHRAAVEAERPDALLCDVVDAVARLHLHAAGDILFDIYNVTRYSYLRWRAVQALIACDMGGDELHSDWLWDCEEATRLLGIERAPRTPSVISRLQRLSTEVAEDASVRAAATKA